LKSNKPNFINKIWGCGGTKTTSKGKELKKPNMLEEFKNLVEIHTRRGGKK